MEAALVVPFNVCVDAADREVHLAEPPRRVIRLLPIDGYIADPATVQLDELFRLHKHAAGAAARVVDPSLVRLDHLDHHTYDRARRVEFPTSLAFRTRELAKEILIDAPEHIARLSFFLAKCDARDKVDQFAKHHRVESRAGVVLREYTLEILVVLLDGQHGLVDHLSDRGLLRVRLKMGPARGGWHPKHVFGGVLVAVFRSLWIFGHKLGALGLEAVGNVLQKDKAECNVFVVRRFHVAAQLVGCLEQFCLKAEVASIAIGMGRLRAHYDQRSFFGWRFDSANK